MNLLRLALFCLVCFPLIGAPIPGPEPAETADDKEFQWQRFVANYDSPKNDPENIDRLRELANEPELPDWGPLLFLYQCRYGSPKRKHIVGELTATMPQIEPFIRKRLAETPQLYENAGQRTEVIQPLTYIRCRWSLNLLGEIMEQSSEMKTLLSPEEFAAAEKDTSGRRGVSPSPNNLNAALTMWKMRLNHFPLRHEPVATAANFETIRNWWRANKDQPDSFFFEGAPDPANPPPWEMPPGWRPTKQAPPDPALAKNDVKPTPAAKPAPPLLPEVPASHSGWLVVVVGALAFISSVMAFKKYQSRAHGKSSTSRRH